ncbi:CPBP family intramembrane glutamic endopeptidase [Natrarchaeobius oligotrophus]|uniref:CPBP family intramembrane metalloprotease n=1 Tax=Natrarchaeobius chitinivorans TaxID=1679083 RepID=A0A3N6MKV4_NATCH|nr:CPBP family intramembrane glutamic endopeptidase [Natrarchaeobius chitinivorans]RQH02045.1 CPBP family intramembrane metalloprotease [Natrarchaeobius chitinivorans]
MAHSSDSSSVWSSAFVHDSLADGVDVLADRLALGLASAVGVIALLFVLIAAYIGFQGGDVEVIPASVLYASSGASLLVVFAIVWVRLEPGERRAAFPVSRPSPVELGWTLAFVPLGVGGFVAGLEAAALAGFGLEPFAYDVTDPATLAAVVFGAVLLAPVVEEALYRGLLLGTLLGRGWSPVAAGLATIALFAALHYPHLGVAGVLAIAGWSIFPTILRLRFDSIVGPWLLHLLNNVYAYVLFVAFVS